MVSKVTIDKPVAVLFNVLDQECTHLCPSCFAKRESEDDIWRYSHDRGMNILDMIHCIDLGPDFRATVPENMMFVFEGTPDQTAYSSHKAIMAPLPVCQEHGCDERAPFCVPSKLSCLAQRANDSCYSHEMTKAQYIAAQDLASPAKNQGLLSKMLVSLEDGMHIIPALFFPTGLEPGEVYTCYGWKYWFGED
jgi:hypothetical protein